MPDSSITLSAEVETVRGNRIAVVTLNYDGGGFDLDWPLSLLPEGTKHGSRLEIVVSAASRETEGEGE